MVSGSTTPCPSYGLVPAAQSARIVTIAVSSRSSRSAGGRERQPEREVLALPPAGADAAERTAAADRVEGRDRLRGDARRAERHRRDQRAEPEPGVEPGEHAEGDPGLGDRLPGGADLRDLDQVVHQGDAGEPGLVGRQRDALQPRRPGPRPRGTGTPGARRRAPGVPAGEPAPRGAGDRSRPRRDGRDVVPALVLQVAQDRREAAQLVGEHLGRHRAVTSGVPGPAELGGRVERDRHGGETVLPCVVDPPGTPYGIQTQGVHDRGEATAHAARDDQLQQHERVLRGVQVVAASNTPNQ